MLPSLNNNTKSSSSSQPAIHISAAATLDDAESDDTTHQSTKRRIASCFRSDSIIAKITKLGHFSNVPRTKNDAVGLLALFHDD